MKFGLLSEYASWISLSQDMPLVYGYVGHWGIVK